MADYQLTATDNIIRTADGACIPPDMANRDYNGDAMQPGYIQWVEGGGVPDPYVPPEPPPPPPPTPEQELLFEHENRIRAIEGEPPLSQDEFVAALAGTAHASEPHADKKGSAPLPKRKR